MGDQTTRTRAPAAKPAPGPLEWGALCVLALVWGTAFWFIKVGVETAPPAGLAFARLSLGAAALAVFALASGKRFPALTDRRWLWFLALGAFGNALPFWLIAVGQQTVPSGLAGILVGAMPLMTIAAAHMVIPAERLTPAKLAGFLLGFVGVVVLIGPSALAGLGGPAFLSQLAILAAAASYATNAILAQLAPETPPQVSGAGMLMGAALLSAPLGVYELATAAEAPSLASAGAIVWLGLFPTGLAALVYMNLVRRAGAGFIALTNYIVPVVAALTGAIAGERLGPEAFAGLAIILLALAIARRRRRP